MYRKKGETFIKIVECGNKGKNHAGTHVPALDLWAGRTEQPCGWLKDRFGVSWQIAPSVIHEILEGPDVQKSQRVMLVLYQMKKIDLLQIMQAAEGR